MRRNPPGISGLAPVIGEQVIEGKSLSPKKGDGGEGDILIS
ncbi:hypothetical protein SBA5_250086 [Candidatus Sulfotelmatomonas gaucii]|uniref:Uncharacterized protein n=1 Tax=Candidatus Sulfuritelmatomonas gaucii TaxID=2043161 RepID=A0A2N9L9A7_9BACT|nr:hypothetical protein SBA5_250086 [Candidatus Sulfotelmatomonas gaucii]